MKSLARIFCLLMISSTAMQAQTKGEMPFSSSPQANQMLREVWVTMWDLKVEEARSMMAEVRKQNPDFAMAHIDVFGVDEKTSKANLEKARSLKMSADEKAIIEAESMLAQKKPVSSYYDPLLKKYKNDRYLNLFIASRLFRSESEKKKSGEILESLVKRSPDFAPAYNLLGYYYISVKDLQKAGASFDTYVSLRPDLANVYDSKADYLMQIGNVQEAINLYEKAATMDAKNHSRSRDKAFVAGIKLNGFKVPERTMTQKHNRLVSLSWNGIALGINYAHKMGQTAGDYGKYAGELFKSSWNKARGFEGFAQGTMANFESARREADPPIQILQQDANSLQFKWKANYKGETEPYASFEEFNQWLTNVYSVIGEHLNSAYEQEVVDNDFLKITIRRK